jgi:mono/diheme cytochrome c family protein
MVRRSAEYAARLKCLAWAALQRTLHRNVPIDRRGGEVLGLVARCCNLLVAIGLLAMLSGCKKDDMAEQPKYRPYQPSSTFADGASERPLVAGVVPREVAFGSTETALAPESASSISIPFPITREAIDRGAERFSIYCTACHGRLGNGRGMIPARGFPPPPSYHIDRLKNETDAHFYNVITNGYGTMYSFNDRILPRDRWCIVAYIRALQAMDSSANLTPDDRKILFGTGDTKHP